MSNKKRSHNHTHKIDPTKMYPTVHIIRKKRITPRIIFKNNSKSNAKVSINVLRQHFCQENAKCTFHVFIILMVESTKKKTKNTYNQHTLYITKRFSHINILTNIYKSIHNYWIVNWYVDILYTKNDIYKYMNEYIKFYQVFT